MKFPVWIWCNLALRLFDEPCWNAGAHVDEYKAAEREMIRIALKHGVQPRCEINSADEAKYYIDLGVRHFCIGDELRNNMTYWNNVGGALKEIVDTL